MSPGHYVIVGDAHDGRDGPTTRVYWHITDRCAERLVRLLCTALNGAGIGFRLKVLNDPAAFTRADAAILYLPTSSWERSRPIVRATHDDLKSMMRPAVSAFAQEIGHGLGVAEDPEEHVSFGQHRSRLVADCLSVAWGTPDPFATLVDEMSARGFPLERIHLNPGSAGIRS